MGVEGLLGGSNSTIYILGVAGFFVVVLISLFVIGLYLKRIKADKGGGQTEPGEWDGIKEYRNPIPAGWAISFVLVLICAIWYWVAGYPLGAYSQVGEYNTEVSEWNGKFSEKWKNPSTETLVDMGKSVYLTQCAPCHGNTLDGNSGRAADLRKYATADFAGSESAIVSFALYGTKGEIGQMPSFEAAGTLNELQLSAAAAYITSSK
ncbi:MAG: c-type cytochrome [Helicobacteraceae bacterium]|jgi:cytochrome c oxidase cbb3-type subunit 3|nr:c-type cytochrome [Helicobacteraceae bacterium]